MQSNREKGLADRKADRETKGIGGLGVREGAGR